jgi:hypothetical protein
MDTVPSLIRLPSVCFWLLTRKIVRGIDDVLEQNSRPRLVLSRQVCRFLANILSPKSCGDLGLILGVNFYRRAAGTRGSAGGACHDCGRGKGDVRVLLLFRERCFAITANQSSLFQETQHQASSSITRVPLSAAVADSEHGR